MKPLPIDLDQLAEALNHRDPHGETSWYLDLRNGEVLPVTDDLLDDLAEEYADIHDRPETFLYIEEGSSTEAFGDMADFVESLPEGEAQRALFRALDMPKPFANFRRTLNDFPDLRERWFHFDQVRNRQRARAFLDEHRIEWTDASRPLDKPVVLDSPPPTPAFELHARLAAGSFPLGRLHRCQLLLKDNALFPWLILVPEVPAGIEDLHQLEPGRYDEVMAAVREVSRFVSDHFQPTKLNVACIGNQVRQMHLHIVARRVDDPAWPGTVWGHEGKRAYAPEQVEQIGQAAAAALALD